MRKSSSFEKEYSIDLSQNHFENTKVLRFLGFYIHMYMRSKGYKFLFIG